MRSEAGTQEEGEENTTAPPAESKTSGLELSILFSLDYMTCKRASEYKRVIQRKNEEIKVQLVMEKEKSWKEYEDRGERRMNLRKRWLERGCGGGEMGVTEGKQEISESEKTEEGKGNDRCLKLSFEWD